MNYNNLDLTRNYERDVNIIDPLDFDTLLLEIQCNIKDINPETVTKQFNEDLQSRIEEAKSIFNANLTNIVKQAKKERQQK